MEARWFFEGTIEPEILTWFQQQEPPAGSQSSRTDYYLLLPGDDSLGIKLREGQVEVKSRFRQLGAVELHPRMTGLVGHWRKWSFPLAEAEANLAGLATPPSAWMAVEKTRQLLRYRFTPDNRLLPAPADEAADRGCELELGQIKIEEQTWWSLCFEAFGNEADLEEIFMQATKQILSTARPPRLEIHHSHSYPGWLAAYAPEMGRFREEKPEAKR
jgi:hypothetical protein